MASPLSRLLPEALQLVFGGGRQLVGHVGRLDADHRPRPPPRRADALLGLVLELPALAAVGEVDLAGEVLVGRLVDQPLPARRADELLAIQLAVQLVEPASLACVGPALGLEHVVLREELVERRVDRAAQAEVLGGEQLVDAHAARRRQVVERDDAALRVLPQDDDLAVAEATQAQRVVRGRDDLHAREDRPQRIDDPHPPAGVQVRAELVDDDDPLGDGRRLPGAQHDLHDVGRERDHRLVAGREHLELDPRALPWASTRPLRWSRTSR